ncbi:MAG: phosphoglycerate kinase, partial [Elusimicrobiota bacterium]
MKLLNSIYIRITSWLLVVSFVFVYICSDYAYAVKYVERSIAENRCDYIDIPIEYGKVIGRHTARGSDRQVIIIQDLHANYEVQKNVRDILQYIDNNFGISKIGLEGSSSQVDTSLLASIPDEEIKTDVIDYFMKKGYVTGAEAYAGYNNISALEGLETASLYEQDTRLLLSSLNKREEFVETLERIKFILKTVEDEICSSDLRKFRSQYINYRQKELSPTDFHRYMSLWAKNTGRAISDISSEYSKFMTLNSKFEALDYREVEKEYQKLLKKIDISSEDGSSLKTVLKELNNFFRAPEALHKEMTRIIRTDRQFSNLRGYIECLELSKEINTYKVMKEEDRVIKEIAAGLCESEDEKDYLFIANYTLLLVKYLLNQLTYDELNEFYKMVDEFDGKYQRLHERCPDEFAKIDSLLFTLTPYVEEMGVFYDIACRRDGEFIKNFVDTAGLSDRNLVMVIGGFHTDGITERLEKKKISYTIVKPGVTTYTDEDRAKYYSLIRRERIKYEAVLAHTLAPASFFHNEWFRKRVVTRAAASKMRGLLAAYGYETRSFGAKLSDFINAYRTTAIKIAIAGEALEFSLGEHIMHEKEAIYPLELGSERILIGIKGKELRMIPEELAEKLNGDILWSGIRKNISHMNEMISAAKPAFELAPELKATIVAGELKPLTLISRDQLPDVESAAAFKNWLQNVNSDLILIGAKNNRGYYIYNKGDKDIIKALNGSSVFSPDKSEYRGNVEKYIKNLIETEDERLQLLTGKRTEIEGVDTSAELAREQELTKLYQLIASPQAAEAGKVAVPRKKGTGIRDLLYRFRIAIAVTVIGSATLITMAVVGTVPAVAVTAAGIIVMAAIGYLPEIVASRKARIQEEIFRKDKKEGGMLTSPVKQARPVRAVVSAPSAEIEKTDTGITAKLLDMTKIIDEPLVIGVVKEIKSGENRIGLTPYGVKAMTDKGFKVIVQKGAGEGSRYSDREYMAAGATMLDTADEVWNNAGIVIKVKEPLVSERKYLREGLILYNYDHLAGDKQLTMDLLQSGADIVPFETIIVDGVTQQLVPMSRIAGRRASWYVAEILNGLNADSRQKIRKKVWGFNEFDQYFTDLPSALRLVNRNVMIFGGGIAGIESAEMALRQGANVTITELNPERRNYLESYFAKLGFADKLTVINDPRVKMKDAISTGVLKKILTEKDFVYKTDEITFDEALNIKNLMRTFEKADAVIDTVYVHGARAPTVVNRQMFTAVNEIDPENKKVIVDVSIDQGGGVDYVDQQGNVITKLADKLTSHDEPVKIDFYGNSHVMIPNIPGSTPRVASKMLEDTTVLLEGRPYLEALAKFGYESAVEKYPELGRGITKGKLTDDIVAREFKMGDYAKKPADLFKSGTFLAILGGFSLVAVTGIVLAAFGVHSALTGPAGLLGAAVVFGLLGINFFSSPVIRKGIVSKLLVLLMSVSLLQGCSVAIMAVAETAIVLTAAGAKQMGKAAEEAVKLTAVEEILAKQKAPVVTKLANGMDVIVQENHRSPVVRLQIVARTGGANEKEDDGRSHFLEHLFFNGTRNRTAAQIKQEMTNLGGHVNGYTSLERTVYHMTVPRENFDRALALLSDVMQNLSISQVEFDKERQVVLREIYMSYNNPVKRLITYILGPKFYTRSNYRHSVLGELDKYNALDIDDIMEYYHARYVPNNMSFIIVGDVDPAEVMGKVSEAFRGFQPAEIAADRHPVEPEKQGYSEHVVDWKGTNLTYSIFQWMAPGMAHRDGPILDLISMILDGGRTSRLQKTVKEEGKLVHDINAGSSQNRYNGDFSVFATLVDQAKYEEMKTAVMEEINKLIRDGVTQKELDRAKKRIKAMKVFERESVEGPASAMTWGTLIGHPELMSAYIKTILEATPQDIRRVAAKYLTKDKLTVVTMKPGETTGIPESPAVSAEDITDLYPARSAVGEAWVRRQEREISKMREKVSKIEKISETRSIEKIVLDNGLTLLISRENSVPSISMELLVKGGIRLEDTENNGINNMATEMLLRGTKNLTYQQINEAIEDRGGSIGAAAGSDSTKVSLKLLSEDTGFGLELLSDIIFNPAFPANDLEMVRRNILNTIKVNADDSWNISLEMIKQAAHGNHPYSMDTLGTDSSVKSLTRSDIEKWHKLNFNPQNMILSISGNVDIDTIKTEVEKYFGALTRNAQPVVVPKTETPLISGVKKAHKGIDRDESLITVAFPAISSNDKDRFVFYIIQNILGSFGGRLFETIREEKGLAYSVGSFFSGKADSGLFINYIETAPEKTGEAIEALWTELENIYRNGFTEEEIERAKESIANGMIVSMQTNEEYADSMASSEVSGIGYDAYTKSRNRIMAVTPEDVQRVMRKYLTPDNYYMSVVAKEGTKIPDITPPAFSVTAAEKISSIRTMPVDELIDMVTVALKDIENNPVLKKDHALLISRLTGLKKAKQKGVEVRKGARQKIEKVMARVSRFKDVSSSDTQEESAVSPAKKFAGSVASKVTGLITGVTLLTYAEIASAMPASAAKFIDFTVDGLAIFSTVVIWLAAIAAVGIPAVIFIKYIVRKIFGKGKVQKEVQPNRNIELLNKIPTIEELKDRDLTGQNVLVRVNMNVKSEDGKIKDTARLDNIKEIVEFLLSKGATPILYGHNGRKSADKDDRQSMKDSANYIDSALFPGRVHFHAGSIGRDNGLGLTISKSDIIKGKINVLENVRFDDAHETGTKRPEFAYSLISLSDGIFIFDAFGDIGSKGASVEDVPLLADEVFAGPAMLREFNELDSILNGFDALVFGGAKLDKIPLLKDLLKVLRHFALIGSGPSIALETEEQKLFEELKKMGPDFVVALGYSDKNHYDIDAKSVAKYLEKLNTLKAGQTVLVNGTMGYMEEPSGKYQKGTEEVFNKLKELAGHGVKVVAIGGDASSTAKKYGLKGMENVVTFTGGGVPLQILAGTTLSGLNALRQSQLRKGQVEKLIESIEKATAIPVYTRELITDTFLHRHPAAVNTGNFVDIFSDRSRQTEETSRIIEAITDASYDEMVNVLSGAFEGAIIVPSFSTIRKENTSEGDIEAALDMKKKNGIYAEIPQGADKPVDFVVVPVLVSKDNIPAEIAEAVEKAKDEQTVTKIVMEYLKGQFAGNGLVSTVGKQARTHTIGWGDIGTVGFDLTSAIAVKTDSGDVMIHTHYWVRDNIEGLEKINAKIRSRLPEVKLSERTDWASVDVKDTASALEALDKFSFDLFGELAAGKTEHLGLLKDIINNIDISELLNADGIEVDKDLGVFRSLKDKKSGIPYFGDNLKKFLSDLNRIQQLSMLLYILSSPSFDEKAGRVIALGDRELQDNIIGFYYKLTNHIDKVAKDQFNVAEMFEPLRMEISKFAARLNKAVREEDALEINGSSAVSIIAHLESKGIRINKRAEEILARLSRQYSDQQGKWAYDMLQLAEFMSGHEFRLIFRNLKVDDPIKVKPSDKPNEAFDGTGRIGTLGLALRLVSDVNSKEEGYFGKYMVATRSLKGDDADMKMISAKKEVEKMFSDAVIENSGLTLKLKDNTEMKISDLLKKNRLKFEAGEKVLQAIQDYKRKTPVESIYYVNIVLDDKVVGKVYCADTKQFTEGQKKAGVEQDNYPRPWIVADGDDAIYFGWRTDATPGGVEIGDGYLEEAGIKLSGPTVYDLAGVNKIEGITPELDAANELIRLKKLLKQIERERMVGDAGSFMYLKAQITKKLLLPLGGGIHHLGKWMVHKLPLIKELGAMFATPTSCSTNGASYISLFLSAFGKLSLLGTTFHMYTNDGNKGPYGHLFPKSTGAAKGVKEHLIINALFTALRTPPAFKNGKVDVVGGSVFDFMMQLPNNISIDIFKNYIERIGAEFPDVLEVYGEKDQKDGKHLWKDRISGRRTGSIVFSDMIEQITPDTFRLLVGYDNEMSYSFKMNEMAEAFYLSIKRQQDKRIREQIYKQISSEPVVSAKSSNELDQPDKIKEQVLLNLAMMHGLATGKATPEDYGSNYDMRKTLSKYPEIAKELKNFIDAKLSLAAAPDTRKPELQKSYKTAHRAVEKAIRKANKEDRALLGEYLWIADALTASNMLSRRYDSRDPPVLVFDAAKLPKGKKKHKLYRVVMAPDRTGSFTITIKADPVSVGGIRVKYLKQLLNFNKIFEEDSGLAEGMALKNIWATVPYLGSKTVTVLTEGADVDKVLSRMARAVVNVVGDDGVWSNNVGGPDMNSGGHIQPAVDAVREEYRSIIGEELALLKSLSVIPNKWPTYESAQKTRALYDLEDPAMDYWDRQLRDHENIDKKYFLRDPFMWSIRQAVVEAIREGRIGGKNKWELDPETKVIIDKILGAIIGGGTLTARSLFSDPGLDNSTAQGNAQQIVHVIRHMIEIGKIEKGWELTMAITGSGQVGAGMAGLVDYINEQLEGKAKVKLVAMVERGLEHSGVAYNEKGFTSDDIKIILKKRLSGIDKVRDGFVLETMEKRKGFEIKRVNDLKSDDPRNTLLDLLEEKDEQVDILFTAAAGPTVTAGNIDRYTARFPHTIIGGENSTFGTNAADIAAIESELYKRGVLGLEGYIGNFGGVYVISAKEGPQKNMYSVDELAENWDWFKKDAREGIIGLADELIPFLLKASVERDVAPGILQVEIVNRIKNRIYEILAAYDNNDAETVEKINKVIDGLRNPKDTEPKSYMPFAVAQLQAAMGLAREEIFNSYIQAVTNDNIRLLAVVIQGNIEDKIQKSLKEAREYLGIELVINKTDQNRELQIKLKEKDGTLTILGEIRILAEPDLGKSGLDVVNEFLYERNISIPAQIINGLNEVELTALFINILKRMHHYARGDLDVDSEVDAAEVEYLSSKGLPENALNDKLNQINLMMSLVLAPGYFVMKTADLGNGYKENILGPLATSMLDEVFKDNEPVIKQRNLEKAEYILVTKDGQGIAITLRDKNDETIFALPVNGVSNLNIQEALLGYINKAAILTQKGDTPYEKLVTGGINVRPGSAFANKTGSWGTQLPVINFAETKIEMKLEGKCINCLKCTKICPDSALIVRDGKLIGVDSDHCKACGLCAVICSKEAIEMVNKTELKLNPMPELYAYSTDRTVELKGEEALKLMDLLEGDIVYSDDKITQIEYQPEGHPMMLAVSSEKENIPHISIQLRRNVIVYGSQKVDAAIADKMRAGGYRVITVEEDESGKNLKKALTKSELDFVVTGSHDRITANLQRDILKDYGILAFYPGEKSGDDKLDAIMHDDYISEDTGEQVSSICGLVSGSRTCAGCGEPIIMGMVMEQVRNAGLQPITIGTSGCLEVSTSIFPQVAWLNSFIHVAFQNTAAVSAGIAAAIKYLVKKGRKEFANHYPVAVAGDGGTYDIGLAEFSGWLERGHRGLYVVLDNGAYMNTGVQRSGATPFGAVTTTTPGGKAEQRKDLGAIIRAHGKNAYVAYVSPSHTADFRRKIKKALAHNGPSVIIAYSSCPPGHRIRSDESLEIAKMAVEANVWPLYEVENGVLRITEKVEDPLKLENWLKRQGRFSHMFDKNGVMLPKFAEGIKNYQATVNEDIRRLEALDGLDVSETDEKAEEVADESQAAIVEITPAQKPEPVVLNKENALKNMERFDSRMLGIRWHGRGGQGAVTVAEILAEICKNAFGMPASAFPFFGPERKGAPVTAFNKEATEKIREHSQLRSTDLSIVIDSTLLSQIDCLSGLDKDGILIVNTPLSPEEIRAEYNIEDLRIYTLDAAKISKFENVPMLGAAVKISKYMGIEFDEADMMLALNNSLYKSLKKKGQKIIDINMEAFKRGYDGVVAESGREEIVKAPITGKIAGEDIE